MPYPLLLPLLLWACLVGPGLCITRRLAWRAEERLCGAIGLSLIFIYLGAFAIHVFELLPGWYTSLTLVCASTSLLTLPAQARLLRSAAVRRALAGYGCLLVWTLLLLCLVRNYSGGACAWDWWEHYQRSLVFLEHRPWDSRYGEMALPARPPLMNVVGAHFLSQVGSPYSIFQVVFTCLNLLVFFPLHLSLRLFGRGGRGPSVLLVGFLMASPMLLWNATWTWTKLLTAFFVVLGVCLYVVGWRRGDPTRTVAAFLSLAAGILTHYSAAPYAVFLAGHYVLFVLPGRRAWLRELAAVSAVCTALLATWFAWSAWKFGLAATLGSNTTVTGMAASSASENALKVFRNVVNSFVPHPLRLTPAEWRSQFDQPSQLGMVRDYAMTLYGNNFLFAIGSVGGFLVLFLVMREFARRRRGVWFAAAFVVSTALLGIAVHPTADPLGVAQICGQPLILMGVAFLAARFTTLPRVLRWLGLGGVAADFALGVMLEFLLEHRVFEVAAVNGRPTLGAGTGLSAWALRNWMDKTQWGVTYCGDYVSGAATLITILLVAGFLAVFVSLSRAAAGRSHA